MPRNHYYKLYLAPFYITRHSFDARTNQKRWLTVGNINAGEIIDNAYKIVQDYSVILDETTSMFAAPLSWLPHKENQILGAIKIILTVDEDPEIWSSMIFYYASLSKFVPDADARKIINWQIETQMEKDIDPSNAMDKEFFDIVTKISGRHARLHDEIMEFMRKK